MARTLHEVMVLTNELAAGCEADTPVETRTLMSGDKEIFLLSKVSASGRCDMKYVHTSASSSARDDV